MQPSLQVNSIPLGFIHLPKKSDQQAVLAHMKLMNQSVQEVYENNHHAIEAQAKLTSRDSRVDLHSYNLGQLATLLTLNNQFNQIQESIQSMSPLMQDADKEKVSKIADLSKKVERAHAILVERMNLLLKEGTLGMFGFAPSLGTPALVPSTPIASTSKTTLTQSIIVDRVTFMYNKCKKEYEQACFVARVFLPFTEYTPLFNDDQRHAGYKLQLIVELDSRKAQLSSALKTILTTLPLKVVCWGMDTQQVVNDLSVLQSQIAVDLGAIDKIRAVLTSERPPKPISAVVLRQVPVPTPVAILPKTQKKRKEPATQLVKRVDVSKIQKTHFSPLDKDGAPKFSLTNEVLFSLANTDVQNCLRRKSTSKEMAALLREAWTNLKGQAVNQENGPGVKGFNGRKINPNILSSVDFYAKGFNPQFLSTEYPYISIQILQNKIKEALVPKFASPSVADEGSSSSRSSSVSSEDETGTFS